MTNKQKLNAIDNLLNRHYRAVLNKDYWDNELRKIKEELTELVTKKKIK